MDMCGKVNSIHYRLKTGMISFGVRSLNVAKITLTKRIKLMPSVPAFSDILKIPQY